MAYNKDKLHKTLDYWSKDMLNFDFFEKGLGIVSLPYFAYDSSRKNFSCNVLLIAQFHCLITVISWDIW